MDYIHESVICAFSGSSNSRIETKKNNQITMRSFSQFDRNFGIFPFTFYNFHTLFLRGRMCSLLHKLGIDVYGDTTTIVLLFVIISFNNLPLPDTNLTVYCWYVNYD